MNRARVALTFVLFLATSCLRAPYQRVEGKEYRLAVPLSGPYFAHANGQGEGTVLDAGTVVRVQAVSMEQKVTRMEPRWCTRCDLPAPCPDIYQPQNGEFRQCPHYGAPVYTVVLTGPPACGPKGCEIVWIMDGRETFESLFAKVFADAAAPAPARPSREVPLGATPDVVRAHLGLADVEDAGQRDAIWRYQRMRCGQDHLLERKLAVEIRFREGRVVGVRQVQGSSWESDTRPDYAILCAAHPG